MSDERNDAPALRELRRILPIGQSRSQTGVTLTIFSLEDFAEGFLVHAGRVIRSSEYEIPKPLFKASDDCGNRYQCFASGGYGRVATGGVEWRDDYLFSPALNQSARELRLAYTEPLGQHATAQSPMRQPDEDGPSSWIFIINCAT